LKPNIHPKYVESTVTCACGTTWTTRSTKPQLRVDVCSSCHPFFTGEQRLMDTAGQVERFMRRMQRQQGTQAAPAAAAPAAPAPAKGNRQPAKTATLETMLDNTSES
jgi:large subunit ribosomal protein L31